MGNKNARSLANLQQETQRGHFDAILHVGKSLGLLSARTLSFLFLFRRYGLQHGYGKSIASATHRSFLKPFSEQRPIWRSVYAPNRANRRLHSVYDGSWKPRSGLVSTV